MIIRWLGHAAFTLEAGATRVVLDPHAPGVLGGRFQLPPIVGPFDAIVVSHAHEDHHAWRPELGTENIIDTDQSVGQLEIRFRAVPHDGCCGGTMGWSRMIRVSDAAGNVVVHCGDIGHWSEDDLAWLADAHAVLIPVGGIYTLGATEAAELCQRLPDAAIVPMHAADPQVDLPLASADDFVQALGREVSKRPQLSLPSPEATGLVIRLSQPR